MGKGGRFGGGGGGLSACMSSFSFDIFNQLVIFVYLDFDVFAFDHLLAVVVCNYEPLSDDVFESIFEDKRIPNIFCVLIRSIDIE